MTDDTIEPRVDGPVADVGDTWSEDSTAWAAPVSPHPPARRVALGAAILLVLVVIASIVALHRSADPQAIPPSLAPVFPPALSTAPAAVGSAVADSPAGGGSVPRPRGTAPTTQPSTPTPTPTAAPTGTPAATQWTTLTVNATKVWNKGDSVRTNRTRLQLQPGGDLVIVDEFDTVRWRSGTAGHGDHAVFQDDGHFVVYDAGNQTWWSSGTAGHNGAVLVLAADGNVNIVFNGAVIWSSHTAH